MRRLLVTTFILSGMFFLLMACASAGTPTATLPGTVPETAVTATPPSTATQTVTPVQTPTVIVSPSVAYDVDGNLIDGAVRNEACTTLVQDTVNATLSEGAGPVHWALIVNFRTIDSNGNPRGCLRLYENVQNKLKQIDSGGFVFETCEIQGDSVGIDPINALAEFKGEGYIACELNIRKWVDALDQKGLLQNLSITNTTAIEEFTSDTRQEYDNFVMYGRGALHGNAGVTPHPVSYYEPETDECCTPVGMSLVSDIDEYAYFRFLLNMRYHEPTTPTLEGCHFEQINTSHHWWADLTTKEGERTGNVSFTWSNLLPDPLGGNCTMVKPGEQEPFNFWIDEATLYIGYWPETPQTEPIWFQGTLEEILIDPCDSKPPSFT